MVIYICYIIIYSFFIYGIIEFFRKIFLDLDVLKKPHSIKIVLKDVKDTEFILMKLKDSFCYIITYIDMDNEELKSMLEILSLEMNIEIRDIEEMKEI